MSIRLLDYAFELDLPIASGHHVFRIHNEGSQPHEASLIKLPPGVSPEAFQQDLDAWLEGRGSAPEVAAAPTVASVASLEPGAQAFLEAALTPGDYALLCFVTAPDGRPHVMHGMIRYLHID